MNKTQSTAKKISKKEAQVLVYNKLADALAEFKKDVKPKKFETKLKKASKLFATDIAKATHKHSNGKLKKAREKITKTKVEEKHEHETAE
jgi:hypothetical protein